MPDMVSMRQLVQISVICEQYLDPQFMKALEHKMINEMTYRYKQDIFDLLENCLGLPELSGHFYQFMFEKLLQLLKKEGISGSDVVLMQKLFDGRIYFDSRLFDEELKENIAQRIDQNSAQEIT